MDLFSHIIFGIFLVMAVNSATKYPLEKYTMYRNSDIADQPFWFILLFAFFGIFMLLFIKPIKQFRKEYYIKNKIRMYEFWVLQHGILPPDPSVPINKVWVEVAEEHDEYYEEYMNNKRYLKLKKLQKKSKRNVYFRKLEF